MTGEAAGPRIGLAMIVRDEAHVVRRCLDSVRRFVDHVAIDDTGSTDGTQEVVRDFLRATGLPGDVVDEPWRDFAHNRTKVLERLRARADIDYVFVIDADDELVFEPGVTPEAVKARLVADVYPVCYRIRDTEYHLPRLFRNAKPFRFRSVLHEFLDCDEPFSRGRLPGLHTLCRHEGARSRRPDKYRRDADTLEAALAVETDPQLIARYTFYLGQALASCGENGKALDAYLRRAEMGFWKDEVFVSLYRAGILRCRLGHKPPAVFETLRAASAAKPDRAEALHQAARLCRELGRNAEGYALARHALTLPYPEHGLFVDRAVYGWRLLDEFSILAARTGRLDESLDAALRLLAENRLPAAERPRIEAHVARVLTARAGRTGAAVFAEAA